MCLPFSMSISLDERIRCSIKRRRLYEQKREGEYSKYHHADPDRNANFNNIIIACCSENDFKRIDSRRSFVSVRLCDRRNRVTSCVLILRNPYAEEKAAVGISDSLYLYANAVTREFVILRSRVW